VRNGFCSIGNRDLTGTIAILMADALLLRIIVQARPSHRKPSGQ